MALLRGLFTNAGAYERVPDNKDCGEGDLEFPAPTINFSKQSWFSSLWERCTLGIMIISVTAFVILFVQHLTALNELKALRQYGRRQSLIPEFPVKSYEFQPTILGHKTSPVSNAAWDSLMPVGRGYIRVTDPQRYSLPPGIPVRGGGEGYALSVFHQLHCLAVLRDTYYRLLNGSFDKVFEQPHEDHCFDYLAQSLMCHADTTVEKPVVEANGARRLTSGWGVTHMCKEWSKVFEFAENHNASTKTGILNPPTILDLPGAASEMME